MRNCMMLHPQSMCLHMSLRVKPFSLLAQHVKVESSHDWRKCICFIHVAIMLRQVQPHITAYELNASLKQTRAWARYSSGMVLMLPSGCRRSGSLRDFGIISKIKELSLDMPSKKKPDNRIPVSLAASLAAECTFTFNSRSCCSFAVPGLIPTQATVPE